jgi:hypothetical protein
MVVEMGGEVVADGPRSDPSWSSPWSWPAARAATNESTARRTSSDNGAPLARDIRPKAERWAGLRVIQILADDRDDIGSLPCAMNW